MEGLRLRGLSQQPGEAEGSLSLEAQARVGAALTTARRAARHGGKADGQGQPGDGSLR